MKRYSNLPEKQTAKGEYNKAAFYTQRTRQGWQADPSARQEGHQERTCTHFEEHIYIKHYCRWCHNLWCYGSVTGSGVGLLTAQKAMKEARLVERKVCFISDVQMLATWREGRHQSKGWLPHGQSVNKSFYRWMEGLHVETAQSALEIGRWWSDQHHLNYFKYN